jgi:stage IV sporulation protein FB
MEPPVFLLEPQETAYDLRFRVAGVPVRVHPTFWLMVLVFNGQEQNLSVLLVGTAAVFLSLLIHELGHAFTMRYFGQAARVVLYMMGGLAIAESGGWGLGRNRRVRGSTEQVMISAAGPGAGFLLAGLTIALILGVGGSVRVVLLHGFEPIPLVRLGERFAASDYLRMFFQQLLWFNIFWGAVNLLPVYPLDGGQIARAVLVSRDPWMGMTRSLWLSVLVGAGVAAVGAMVMQDWFIAILFGLLAASNYQMLQQAGGGRPW